MQQQDGNRFRELLLTLGTIHEIKFSDDLIESWWFVLEPYTIEQVSNGVKRHLSDPNAGQYKPKPASIIAHIVGTDKEKIALDDANANLAWQEVIDAIRRVGSYNTPTFKDPLIGACVSSLGGWISLCGSTTDQLTWKGKEFCKMYTDYKDRPLDRLPSNIAGREDMQQLKHEQAQNITGLLENMQKHLGGA